MQNRQMSQDTNNLTTEQKDGAVQSVVRAMHILNCFMGTENEYGLIEISKMVGLNKSTVHRLLSTLESCKYIKQNPENGKYTTGINVLLLGLTVIDNMRLKEVAHPFLQQLVDYSSETANIGVIDDGRMVYVDTVDSTRAIRTFTKIGQIVPLHTSAIGKILMAALSDREILEIARRYGLEKKTEKTITTPEALLEEIDRVRKEGCAYDIEEDDDEMMCVASKVVNHQGEIVAGISISGTKQRMNEKLTDYRDKVKETAYFLSKELGYSGPRF